VSIAIAIALVVGGAATFVFLRWWADRTAAPMPETADAETGAAPNRTDTDRLSLGVLVTVGTIAVAVVGAALFFWFAWVPSHQPAPLRGDTGWWTWLSHVSGAELGEAARTTVTTLAVIGIGGAALVAYRRQKTAERTQLTAARAQQVATDAQDLDVLRRNDDRERELRARFTTIAEQLGSDKYAVRHAGAYALASLADDWHRFGNDSERQVCVNLLCAQLRSPRQKVQRNPEDVAMGEVDFTDSPEDLEVRKTIVAQIRSHRPVKSTDEYVEITSAARPVVHQPPDWNSCSLNLSGADLSEFDFQAIDLSSANLEDADLSHARLAKADLSDAMMTRAKLSGTDFTDATMLNARLYSAYVVMDSESLVWPNRAVFNGANLQGAWFTSARLRNADFEHADLTGAKFPSAELVDANFDEAILTKARFQSAKLMNASFHEADVRSANFTHGDTTDADFTDAKHDKTTKWFRGVVPEVLLRAPLEKSDG
jgi:uncharacterized protein YjbI with pentapeptide repeats